MVKKQSKNGSNVTIGKRECHRGFNFKLEINDYGSPVAPEEIERILSAYFQCVHVKNNDSD